MAQERQQREAKIISQGVHPAKPTDPPARVKVEQPKVAAPPQVVHVQAPAPPVVPQHVEQPIPKHEPINPIHVNPPPKKAKGSSQLHKEMFNAPEEAASVSEKRQEDGKKTVEKMLAHHRWPYLRFLLLLAVASTSETLTESQTIERGDLWVCYC